MKRCFLLSIAALLLAGCFNSHNVQNRVDATGFNLITAKKGADCTYAVLGLLPLTKTDIDHAARKGNIRSLGYVEYSYAHFILFSRSCVVVYGK